MRPRLDGSGGGRGGLCHMNASMSGMSGMSAGCVTPAAAQRGPGRYAGWRGLEGPCPSVPDGGPDSGARGAGSGAAGNVNNGVVLAEGQVVCK